jgi:hypothetical protein
MRVFVYLPLLASLLTALVARPLARRADPRNATRVLCATGVALAATSAASLALLAFPLIASIPIVAATGRWPSAAVARYVPVPIWLSALAALCIIGVALEACLMFKRYGTDLVTAARIQHGTDDELVVLDDPAVYAFACRPWPFRAGVILVSDGCLRSLDEEEQAAVVAHERSHLSHHHALYQLVAEIVGTVNPLLRPIQRQIGYSLERWADEDAAATIGREITATALATTATTAARRESEVVLSHATSYVPERIRALLDEPRSRSRALLTVTTANAIVAATAVVFAARNTEAIFELLRR